MWKRFKRWLIKLLGGADIKASTRANQFAEKIAIADQDLQAEKRRFQRVTNDIGREVEEQARKIAQQYYDMDMDVVINPDQHNENDDE